MNPLLDCLQACLDSLAELVGEHDPKIIVARSALHKAKLCAESDSERSLPQTVPRVGTVRPSLAQALEMAILAGVTQEEADSWWNAREASDWTRGHGGGGTLPIGTNHAADLKTWVNSFRQRNVPAVNGNGHSRPKTETVWALRQSMEAVEAELGRLEEKSLYDPLSVGDRDLKARLKTRRSELRTKLAGLSE